MIAMKLKFRFSICLALMLIVLCSFSNSKTSYQTECVSLDIDGYFTIKIWDTKKGNKYRLEDARKDAIHAILYSGIAGTNGCGTQQPILNKKEDHDNFNSIKRNFFAKKGKWSAFTRSASTETIIPLSLGIKEWKVYQVSISKASLRQYLEELKIIKSLNNQF